jgi:EAL domain-containing protein (putative c-di-GMP-specific phosphodiesterase class I)
VYEELTVYPPEGLPGWPFWNKGVIKIRIEQPKTMETNLRIDLPFIKQYTERKNSFLTGRMDGLKLYTALQPVFSIAHKRVVGYEALLRVKNSESQWISPAPLFEKSENPFADVHLDRLCRYIHLNNFLNLKDEINWLFLNVSPVTIGNAQKYGPFFKSVIESFDFPAHRIVIEIVEYPIGDNDCLKETVDFYKDLGCLIAIDDFGAGASNFDRIWTLNPNIVKLDRSFLIKASMEKSIRHLLPGIVSLLHQAGSLVLIEGVETREQAIISIESDVDFVQGFYFGKPSIELSRSFEKEFKEFDPLLEEYKTLAYGEDIKFQRKINRYRSVFNDAATRLMNGLSFEKATRDLLSQPAVVRCYRIGADGIQMGNTLVSEALEPHRNDCYRPLDDARSADWFRRHYLKRALLHPGQLQISRPYLSITGAHMCITLSMKFSDRDKESVLCCDLIA